MRTDRPTLSATRGHTHVISAVIVLVIAAVVIVPIVLLTHAKTRIAQFVVQRNKAKLARFSRRTCPQQFRLQQQSRPTGKRL